MSEEFRIFLGIPAGHSLACTGTEHVLREDREITIHSFDEVDENVEVITTHTVQDERDPSDPSNRVLTVLA